MKSLSLSFGSKASKTNATTALDSTPEAPEQAASNAVTASSTRQDEDPEKQQKEHRDAQQEDDGFDEVQIIPKNNLLLVVPALGLVAFISGLDQTIIATALPTIQTDLGLTAAQYSWVGTSYMLAQTIMTPLNGRFTDIVGRKPALYFAISMMIIFSTLCGTAKNTTWLIVARSLTGVGGGSIVGLVVIVISDIVPLRKRGIYQGYMSFFTGTSSVLGPLLGGVLTEHLSWRWCFFINLPTCGIALVLLVLTLNLNPTKRKSIAEIRRTFDFLGLLLVITGATLLILGFSMASDDGFNVPRIWGILIAGFVIAVLAVVHSLTTKRNAILPARMLRTRTTLFFLIASFFNSCLLVPSSYLLPQFFQGVRGVSSETSGVLMIGFSAGATIASISAGHFTSHFQIVRPVAWFGFFCSSIGYGLYYGLFNPSLPIASQEVVMFLTGAGIGMSIGATMLVIQAAMPPRDMAAATSGWVMMRSLGATVGTATMTAILNADMLNKFSQIPGYGTEFSIPKGVDGYHALHQLPEPLQTTVIWAFSDSFKTCWILGCALLISALILTIWTKSYSLERTKTRPTSEPTRSQIDHTSDAETTEKPPFSSPDIQSHQAQSKPMPEIPMRESGGADVHTQTALATVRSRSSVI